MINHIVTAIRSYFPEQEEGQGLVEYGLILALVAVVAIVGLIILGPAVRDLLSALGTSI